MKLVIAVLLFRMMIIRLEKMAGRKNGKEMSKEEERFL
jgi:hypothetical protein